MDPPLSPLVRYAVIEKLGDGKEKLLLITTFCRKELKTVPDLQDWTLKELADMEAWDGKWACRRILTLPPEHRVPFFNRGPKAIKNDLDSIDYVELSTPWRRENLDTLLLEEDGQLLVVVEKIHKRDHEPDSNFSNKRPKLLDQSPSSMSKAHDYETLQQSGQEKLLDDRPAPDAGIPPISLLYEGFGIFDEIMEGHINVPELSLIDLSALEVAVDNFANDMAKFFRNEDARRDNSLAHLNVIFSRPWGGTQIPPVQASAIGPYQSDGHYVAIHNTSAFFQEVKARISGITSIPEVELACYFGQLNDVAKITYSKLFEAWQVPCLVLTVVGYLVTFYAVISCQNRIRIVSLTPTLSCLQSASNGRDRTSLYRAFAAACVVQARILDDAKQLLQNLPPPLPSPPLLPSVSQLQKYPPSADGEFVQFQILDSYPLIREGRHLYLAKSDNKQILIKFTKRYSPKLHAICAKTNHAPKLLAFQKLRGGYFGVAMEHIETAEQICSSMSLADNWARWAIELESLVKGFHHENLVHGDLRAANIICDNQNVMLVDFDWGGNAGEVAYPTANLHPDLLKNRAHEDLVIRKHDDERILQGTINYLKSLLY